MTDDDKLIEAMIAAYYADGATDAREMMRAALAVVRAHEGWQPIETAPRGEYLLLSDGEDVEFGEYGWDEGEDERPVFIHDGPGIRGMSHWRPLPEPPA